MSLATVLLALLLVHSLSSIRQVQAHDAVVRLQDRRVSCKVSRGSGVRLDVDAPQVWVQTEGGERSFLTQQLNLIDNLCTSIVPEIDRRHSSKRIISYCIIFYHIILYCMILYRIVLSLLYRVLYNINVLCLITSYCLILYCICIV